MSFNLKLRTDCCEHPMEQTTTEDTDRILKLSTHKDKAEAYFSILEAWCDCKTRKRRCADCRRRRSELYAYLKGHPTAYWCGG